VSDDPPAHLPDDAWETFFEGLATELATPPVRWPEDTPIFVDSREPDDEGNNIAKWLREHRVPVEVRQLEDEDYLIGDVHFTRKTYSDMMGSLESGHLQDELARLLTHNRKCVFILEKGALNRRGAFLYGRLLQARDAFNEGIPIKDTADTQGTVDYLLRVRRRIIAGKFAAVRRKPVVYGNVSDLATMYSTLPGIGTTIAEELAEKYPTPEGLVAAIRRTYEFNPKKHKTKVKWREKRWDAGVRGIGEDRAEAVAAAVLDGKWPEKK
jgi:ERCC4-type nuclease